MRKVFRPIAVAFALMAGFTASANAVDVVHSPDSLKPVHGLALHGDLKYGPEFQNFAYVHPKAPKGGTLRMATTGTFDSLNPWIVKGVPAMGLGMNYATLLTDAADEAFSRYGYVAESMILAPDRSWIIFNIRPQARFHDGQPITAEDVVFSFEALTREGDPLYRMYYASVVEAKAISDHSVKFSFKPGENRELPLILGQLPILPKHWWKGRDFSTSTLDAPVGSGPYKVKAYEPGRFIEHERVKDWWGETVPAIRGTQNFDILRYDYFRDDTVALEAFKAGKVDLRIEASAKNWATAYDFPARASGKVILKEFTDDAPSPMQSFVFNLRRPLFQDARVREALGYTFDFEWTNQNLFYGQYVRTRSYFDNSELAARDLPSEAELKLLEPLRGKIPDRVFTESYQPPSTTGEGGYRANLKKALDLFAQAGWEVRNGVLTNKESGQPFQFEILIDSPAMERLVVPFAKSLERIGIKASVRNVDTAQYQARVNTFDYDMVVGLIANSLSPGNEQREYFGAAAADHQGSRNYAGLKSEAVDALIEAVIAAPDRPALVAACRALDRVLQWSFLGIPQYHSKGTRIAYWDKFGMPSEVPVQGVQLTAWWEDPTKAAALGAK